MNSRSSEQTYPIIAASGDLLAVLGWLKEKNKAELVFVSTDVFSQKGACIPVRHLEFCGCCQGTILDQLVLVASTHPHSCHRIVTNKERVIKGLPPSVQFSCSVVSDSFRPHGLQHTRLPYPSPSPRTCSNSCPLSQ